MESKDQCGVTTKGQCDVTTKGQYVYGLDIPVYCEFHGEKREDHCMKRPSKLIMVQHKAGDKPELVGCFCYKHACMLIENGVHKEQLLRSIPININLCKHHTIETHEIFGKSSTK